MSQAFIREGEDQWLEDVAPSINALMMFLTRENNGHPVTERSRFKDSRDRQVYMMSNGLAYTKNDQGQWQVA